MPKKQKTERLLSASRIGTLEKCSYSYWCNYHLKVPQNTHPGALRGTICHLVFELLLNKKHKKHFNSMIKKDSITGSKAVNRLVIGYLKKHKIFNDEHYDLCDDMILVGLKEDFFGKTGKVEKHEEKFTLISEDPKFKVIGFMDKPIKYAKEKKVKIVDYKSSKNKFKGEELTANTQAIVYTMAAKQLWPKMKKFVMEFLFLRYPRKPSQIIEVTEEQVDGYKHYLEHLFKLINNFTEKEAKTNFAKNDNSTKWLCGWPGTSWVCPYRNPVKYFALLDEEKNIIKTSFKNVFEPKDSETVEEKHYKGCPAYFIQNEAQGDWKDDFDF